MNPTPTIDIESLMSRMQKEDKRKRKFMNIIFFVYLIFSVYLAVLFFVYPEPNISIADRISELCYLLAFIFGSWYFRREYKMYKKMDYTLPLIQLLEKTEKRFRFFNRKWFPISIIFVLIEIAEVVPYLNEFMIQNQAGPHHLLFIQAILLSSMAVGVTVGYFIWRSRNYTIWKDTKTLLSELKN